jgi:hypothetical protein
MNEQVTFWLQRAAYLLLPYLTAAAGITLISFTPIGRAVVSWLKGHVNRGRAAELAGELEQLRDELGQVQERLDFTERQLTGRSPGAGQSTPRQLASEIRIPTPV